MWIIATEDLSVFIPDTERGAARTSVDVSERGLPRLFDNPNSAAKALGHWLAGPYEGLCDDGHWYYGKRTDPNRKLVWEGKLAPREVQLAPVIK